MSQAPPRHEDVSALQDSLNEANRIFGYAPEPLRVDGDLGPETAGALVAAARAAGTERLTDHIGKRLGIGERQLVADRGRGFDYALPDEDKAGGGYGFATSV